MNESKGIVYLSGPITDNARYHEDFRIADRLVRMAGYTAVSPDILPDGLKQKDYMRICLAMLEAADTLVALKGWSGSQGAMIEWAYAQKIGRRCLTLAQFCEENHILAASKDMEVGKREQAG